MTRSSKKYVLTVGLRNGTDNTKWPVIVEELNKHGIDVEQVDVLDVPITGVMMISADGAWEGIRGDYLSLLGGER